MTPNNSKARSSIDRRRWLPRRPVPGRVAAAYLRDPATHIGARGRGRCPAVVRQTLPDPHRPHRSVRGLARRGITSKRYRHGGVIRIRRRLAARREPPGGRGPDRPALPRARWKAVPELLRPRLASRRRARRSRPRHSTSSGSRMEPSLTSATSWSARHASMWVRPRDRRRRLRACRVQRFGADRVRPAGHTRRRARYARLPAHGNATRSSRSRKRTRESPRRPSPRSTSCRRQPKAAASVGHRMIAEVRFHRSGQPDQTEEVWCTGVTGGKHVRLRPGSRRSESWTSDIDHDVPCGGETRSRRAPRCCRRHGRRSRRSRDPSVPRAWISRSTTSGRTRSRSARRACRTAPCRPSSAADARRTAQRLSGSLEGVGIESRDRSIRRGRRSEHLPRSVRRRRASQGLPRVRRDRARVAVDPPGPRPPRRIRPPRPRPGRSPSHKVVRRRTTSPN